MSSIARLAVLSAAAAGALAGCSRQSPVATPPETRAERLVLLDRIAADCRVPRAMMELVGEDELQLNPPVDLAFERVDCVLGRVEALNLPPGKLHFVRGPAPGADANAAARADTNAMNAVAAAEANNAQAD